MKINKTIIKTSIISLVGIVGIVIGFAVDPSTIPISILWGVFLAAIFIASIGVVLLIEVIIK